MSNVLFKSPHSANKRTGNVCLSHAEYEAIQRGEHDTLAIEGDEFNFSKRIEGWMVEKADVRDEYVLFPYTEKSFLVKNK